MSDSKRKRRQRGREKDKDKDREDESYDSRDEGYESERSTHGKTRGRRGKSRRRSGKSKRRDDTNADESDEIRDATVTTYTGRPSPHTSSMDQYEYDQPQLVKLEHRSCLFASKYPSIGPWLLACLCGTKYDKAKPYIAKIEAVRVPTLRDVVYIMYQVNQEDNSTNKEDGGIYWCTPEFAVKTTKKSLRTSSGVLLGLEDLSCNKTLPYEQAKTKDNFEYSIFNYFCSGVDSLIASNAGPYKVTISKIDGKYRTTDDFINPLKPWRSKSLGQLKAAYGTLEQSEGESDGSKTKASSTESSNASTSGSRY